MDICKSFLKTWDRYDGGYNWENHGNPPFFPEYTFIRAAVKNSSGNLCIPYQYYPVTRAEHDRILSEEQFKGVFFNTKTPYCESGVIIRDEKTGAFTRHAACRMDMSEGWIWSEPTVANLSDGSMAMLMRKCRSGWLYRCDSPDGGKTWGEYYKTDIPNPTNKPRLINLDGGRIAFIHTPNNAGIENGGWALRFPLELWISDDDMKSWSEKIRLTDFPGAYSYSDGFYEDGHIHFVIEHNRHTILYFDVEL